MDLNFKIRDYCRNWQEKIVEENIRSCYNSIAPNMKYSEFKILFLEATGYVGYNDYERFITYADPVLESVAYDLLLCKKVTSEGHLRLEYQGKNDPDFPHLVDIRYEMASFILMTLNLSNPSLNREYNNEQFKEWVMRIVRGIPPSRRWVVCPPIKENAHMITSLYKGDFQQIKQEEYKFINILEDDNIGWIATYCVDEQLLGNKSYITAFQPFMDSLGISDFRKYTPPLYFNPNFYRDPEAVKETYAVDIQVNAYAKSMNASPNAISLSFDRIRKLRLADLENIFIPIFYQLDNEIQIFAAAYDLIEANNVARLCISIPEARKHVLQGFEKGAVFEQYIYNLLTGKERVELLFEEEMPFPFGFVRSAGRQDLNATNFVRYSYTAPTGSDGFRIPLTTSSNSPTNALLEALYKSQTDIDILLVHRDPPEHILIGEAKFTSGYKEDYYLKGAHSLEVIARGVAKAKSIRRELHLPLSIPVVPCIFVSHFGEFVKNNKNSIKVPMTILLSGWFNRVVLDWLRMRSS